jgi:predicted AlkP superfamily phosphohydrolase/phosphomutase
VAPVTAGRAGAPARVIVIGLDAANPQLLRQWMADGTLPALRALMQRGVSGDTTGVAGFFIGSTWPSFYTGLSPAGHGVHYLVQLDPGTYRYRRMTSGAFVTREPFWAALGRAGLRTAILDVPLTKLDPRANGMQIVEWGSHDALYGFGASPPDIVADVRNRFGAHPLTGPCDATRRSSEDYARFVDTLLEGVRRKAQLTKHYLAQGQWDFFMQVFTEAHCAGHQCWHLHDASHPAHDPGVAARIGDPLKRVYQAIDSAVGEIAAMAGDALVIAVAPHGMSHWYGAQFLFEEILVRLGVSQRRPPAPPSDSGAHSAFAAARWVWRRLPAGLQRVLAPVRTRLRAERPREPEIGVDPESSDCFPVLNGLAVGGIRLNIIGREPRGRLAAGADADAFAHRLSESLLHIVDERTGQPAVSRVIRTSDLYDGEYRDTLPDLLVEWSDAVATGSRRVGNGAGALVRLRSPEIGVVEGSNDYGRTGENRPDGLFVAAGGGVVPAGSALRVSLLDFAPTFAALFGIDIPSDGRRIPELRLR